METFRNATGFSYKKEVATMKLDDMKWIFQNKGSRRQIYNHRWVILNSTLSVIYRTRH